MNRYERPFDNRLEAAVKSVIQKNYPEIASRGGLNVAVENRNTGSLLVEHREGGGASDREYFICGTTMWGSNRVVAP